ncbi:MAG: ABC transporter substrate-binding protein [Gammaproteobacteria bacterium HGW-Gammaproteobacteria-3]|nr:MAG: ABC transporter substrate-binding protein [Gammaproteobacteria bacterium HGW-Gammaproteobacteria-3]
MVLLLITGVWSYFKMAAVQQTGNETSAKIEKLVLTGSSTVAPLAAEIGKRFESLHPNVRVDVQTGGSSRGVNDARAGLADIGMASRALKPDEADLKSFTIALDGISVIINAANPVTVLDKQQIIDIYTGKIVNWQAVGGNDAPITVVNKAEGRSTLELFLQHFGLNNTEVKAQVVIGDNQQGIKTVAGNPDAIGYVSVGAAEYEAGHAVAIKLLPLEGVAASVENVRNRSFPLSRPLNLVTQTEPTGIVKSFIDFAGSTQVNDLIEAQYFVPVQH